jgi:hypothetical protein
VAVESSKDVVERGGVLADLDVAGIRQMLVKVMFGGGVPVDRMMKVMKCSKASIYRYAAGPPTDPDPDPT